MKMKLLSRPTIFLMCIAIAILPSLGQAATIAQIGTEDLVNKSELIFEGTVISVRTELNVYNRIYTYIEFSVEDALLGESEPTLTLRFSGGKTPDEELDLGVRIPQLGERGIYFVEKVMPGLINPLLGWEQGHFMISSVDTVVAANSLEVETVELRSRPPSAEISEGVALGIKTQVRRTSNPNQNILNITEPMSVSEFKTRIRELIQ